MKLNRRTLLATALVVHAVLAGPAFAQGAAPTVLRVVPHSNLAILDPI